MWLISAFCLIIFKVGFTGMRAIYSVKCNFVYLRMRLVTEIIYSIILIGSKWNDLILLLHQKNEVNFEVHQLIAWQLGLLQYYLFANLGYSQVTILQSPTNNLVIAELDNFYNSAFCFDLVIG